MFCPNCGKDNGPNYKFCAECGTDLGPGASAPGRPAESTPGGAVPTAPIPPPPPPLPASGTAGGWGGNKPPDPFAGPSAGPAASGFASTPGGPGGWSSSSGGSSESWSAPAPSGYPEPSSSSGRRLPTPIILAVVGVVVLLLGFGLYKVMRSGKSGATPSPATTVASATTPAAPATTGRSSSSGGTTTGGAPIVKDVVLCKGFRGLGGGPVEPTTTFKATETLRCAVRLGEVHTGQRVTGAWKGPGCDKGTNLTTDRFGTWVGHFEATPDGSWQAGRYTFTLSIDGSVARTVDFEVSGSGTGSTPSIPATAQAGPAAGVIQEVTMCKGVQKPGAQAINPTSVFSPSEAFYCVVTVKGAKVGQVIQCRWFEGNTQRREATEKVGGNGSGNVEFHVAPVKPWQPGTYRVEILLDGVLGRSAVFEVR